MVRRPTVLWTTVPWATVLWPKKAWPIQPRPFGPRAAGHDRRRDVAGGSPAQHAGLGAALLPAAGVDCDIPPLRRYLDVGVSYLSVNVGYAPHGIEETVRVLASWRRQVQRSEEFVLATTAAMGRWEEFRLHVRAGFAHDLELCDLKEVLLQTAIYAGVPAANTGFHIAAEELNKPKGD